MKHIETGHGFFITKMYCTRSVFVVYIYLAAHAPLSPPHLPLLLSLYRVRLLHSSHNLSPLEKLT